MKKIFLTIPVICLSFCFANAQKISNTRVLNLVSLEYNKRADLWGSPSDKIDINKIPVENNSPLNNDIETPITIMPSKKNIRTKDRSEINKKSKLLDEVVVLGYETVKKPFLNSTVSTLSSSQMHDISVNSTTEGITGRLAGVEIVTSDGEPGAEATINVRGINSITQNGSPLIIIDGVRVESGINSITPQDIDNITVLKDAAASAIYGASGANGVMIVTTKSAKNYENDEKPPIKDQEDISYIQAMKQSLKQNKYAEFASLEATNSNNVTFYMDMALYFNEIHMDQYVDEMLTKASQCENAVSIPIQCNIAFAYDYMKKYDKAIAIYKSLINETPDELSIVRDLGWAYFENNQYDSAVKVLYNGIIKPVYPISSQNIKLKDIMLADMNMIIALQKDNIDLSYIPAEIIKPVPVKLRVIIESPYPFTTLSNLSAKQPWKRNLNIEKNIGKNNTRLQFADEYYSICELQTNKPGKKPFLLKTELSGRHYNGKPNFVRVITIKNFGTPAQTINTDFISLDNQEGETQFDDLTVKTN